MQILLGGEEAVPRRLSVRRYLKEITGFRQGIGDKRDLADLCDRRTYVV
jgi:hypothetical protein